METVAQIKNNLKLLRLNAMRENVENRITEGINNKMSYHDFLLLLTQDEIARRQNAKIQRLITRANLGKYKGIVDFNFEFNKKINRQQILNFMSCEFIRANENIVFEGTPGTGKTMLAKAIGLESCRKGFSVKFIRCAKMLDSVYGGKADNTYQKKLNSFVKPDLLIIDDWGMHPFSAIQLNILNEIMSERYENGSFIITSNRPVANWDELFNDAVVSSALLDRLFYQTHKIKIIGNSYRRKLPEKG